MQWYSIKLLKIYLKTHFLVLGEIKKVQIISDNKIKLFDNYINDRSIKIVLYNSDI